MTPLGYAYLHQALGLPAFEPQRPARIAPVTRVTIASNALLVPAHVAPQAQDPLSHILFALKHEGTNLQILAQALPRVPAEDLTTAIRNAPSSAYIRIACYLWEYFTGKILEAPANVAGPTANLFDPRRYLTTRGIRNPKWRVRFNGLGSPDYCVTVERTSAIEDLLAQDILGQATAFLGALEPAAADRALSWAYLHETESSFAIEREKPSATKAETFVTLLQQAYLPHPLNEDYLVSLQNATITNPPDKAAAYRHQQNWLRGPLRGAAGITYVPPPPESVSTLMTNILALTDQAPKTIDPLVIAAVVSFAFVFVHPFMDGNGRLSRFLFHQVLAQSGKLPNGLLLPVSIAMKRNESAYLVALQSFSVPARKWWEVRWLDGEEYALRFMADDTLYRYWDATTCVTFGLQMAQQALERDLREETEFLARYDHIFKAVDDRFDVRNPDLTTLVLSCLQQNGRISASRRKQYRLTVADAVFDAIEQAWAESFEPT